MSLNDKVRLKDWMAAAMMKRGALFLPVSGCHIIEFLQLKRVPGARTTKLGSANLDLCFNFRGTETIFSKNLCFFNQTSPKEIPPKNEPRQVVKIPLRISVNKVMNWSDVPTRSILTYKDRIMIRIYIYYICIYH